jgi:hypothetical protein
MAAVELYAEHPAMAGTDLAAEVRLLAAVRAELAGHAAARAEALIPCSCERLEPLDWLVVGAGRGLAVRSPRGRGVPAARADGAPHRDRAPAQVYLVPNVRSEVTAVRWC